MTIAIGLDWGYMIEIADSTSDKRFWVDMPAYGVKEFGEDHRARVFFSSLDANIQKEKIYYELGFDCKVTKRSDFYPQH